MNTFSKQVLLFATIICAGLTGCSEVHKVRDDDYFKNAKALYIIDGTKYAVPMGYHWYKHIKYNQWPTPKEEYTETTAFSIDVLLPDFAPYSNQNAAQFDNATGQGDVMTVSVASISSKYKPLPEIVKVWKESGHFDQLPQKSELSQLTRYVRKPGDNSPARFWKDVYLPVDIESPGFWIECDYDVPSPNCKLYDYGGSSGPSYESVFASKYLPRWQELRKQAVTLIDSFVIQSSSSN